MEPTNSDNGNRAMLENAIYDFLDRQPIKDHAFQMVQTDCENMKYIILDRFFTAYRIYGSGESYYIDGVADDGSRYLNTYGNSLEEIYDNLSGMVPAMNMSPDKDGRLKFRKEGLFNPDFLDFDYTFRNVVYNIDAYRKSVFEGLTYGKPELKPLEGTDEDVDRQIRKFAEMSESTFVYDRPKDGEYRLRSPEGIEIEYRIYKDFMTIRSELGDISGMAETLRVRPFDLYVALCEKMPFSPVFKDGKLYYVNRDIGEDSPMRKCIMEQSFDCLEAHDAYRIRKLDLNF